MRRSTEGNQGQRERLRQPRVQFLLSRNRASKHDSAHLSTVRESEFLEGAAHVLLGFWTDAQLAEFPCSSGRGKLVPSVELALQYLRIVTPFSTVVKR